MEIELQAIRTGPQRNQCRETQWLLGLVVLRSPGAELSGREGSVSGRWGLSACGRRPWPACWTWDWNHKGAPRAPIPCQGCSRRAPTPWLPQPPCRRETTISIGQKTENTLRHVPLKHTTADLHNASRTVPSYWLRNVCIINWICGWHKWLCKLNIGFEKLFTRRCF